MIIGGGACCCCLSSGVVDGCCLSFVAVVCWLCFLCADVVVGVCC